MAYQKMFITVTDEQGILLDRFEALDDKLVEADLPGDETLDDIEFLTEPCGGILLSRLRREFANLQKRKDTTTNVR